MVVFSKVNIVGLSASIRIVVPALWVVTACSASPAEFGSATGNLQPMGEANSKGVEALPASPNGPSVGTVARVDAEAPASVLSEVEQSTGNEVLVNTDLSAEEMQAEPELSGDSITDQSRTLVLADFILDSKMIGCNPLGSSTGAVVLIVGYDKDTFIIKGSWGTDLGQ